MSTSAPRGSAPTDRIRIVPTPFGAPAVAALRQEIESMRAGDPLSPVLVIVRDALTGVGVRRLLAERGGIAAVETLTSLQLADRLAGPRMAAEGRTPLTAPATIARLRAHLREHPGPFGEIASHPATARAVAAAVGQLRRLGDEERRALEAALGHADHRARLAQTVLEIGDLIHRELAETRYDTTDLLRAAVPCVAEADLPQRVVVHLPGPLDAAECDLLRRLGEHGELRLVLGLTGTPGDARLLQDAARIAGRPLAAAETAAPAPALADEVLHTSDPDDEVRWAVREVLTALQDTPAHRIAVLHTSADPYARILHEQLTAAGLAFSAPAVRPPAERGAGRLLRGLLDLQREDFPRARTLGVLGSLPLRAPEDGRRIPVATWERLSRRAGVVSGADWEERLGTLLAQKESEEEAGQGDAEQLRRLIGTVRGLREQLALVERARTWQDGSDRLLRLLDALIRTDALGDDDDGRAEQLALVAVRTAVQELAALDAVAAAAAPDGGMLEAIDEALAEVLETGGGRTGRFGDGILVGPLTAAAGLELDLVIVLGASEDLCPGRPAEDALLPDELRVATAGALPTVPERTAASGRDLAAALALAPRRLVSFSRGDLRSRAGRLPSRFLMPSVRALSGDPSAAATDYALAAGLRHGRSFLEGLGTTALPATAQEHGLREVLAGTASERELEHLDPLLARADAMIRARGARRPSRFDGFIGPDPVLSLTVEGATTSATALESYVACPHAYFMSRVLRVEPLEEPEAVQSLSPLEKGNVVHAAIDRLIREAGDRGELPGYGEPWSEEQHARLRAIGAQIAEEFESRGLTGPTRLWQRTRAGLLDLLDQVLRGDSAWRARHRLAVHASEVTFGRERDGQEFPPLEIPLPAGTLRMTGAADKVDRDATGRYVVTDIKTGKATRYKDITGTDPLAGGTRLQLPSYARALRVAYDLPEDAEITARYWFTADGHEIPVRVDGAVEERYRRTLEVISDAIAAGVFPARPPKEKEDHFSVQCAFCNPDHRGYGTVRTRWEDLAEDRPDAEDDGSGSGPLGPPAWRALLGVLDPRRHPQPDTDRAMGQTR